MKSLTWDESNKKYKIARYKNFIYRLLYAGPTKYGPRAKLQFLNNSYDFWVNLESIEIIDYIAPNYVKDSIVWSIDHGFIEDGGEDYRDAIADAFLIDVGDR